MTTLTNSEGLLITHKDFLETVLLQSNASDTYYTTGANDTYYATIVYYTIV